MSRRDRHSQRGAILVQVAILAMVLIGFTAFVVDYGVMWVGRRQAQNAADAGALAGAVAMAFDANGWTNRAPTGPARAGAHQMALDNAVWGQSPNVNIDTDVYFTNTPADMCPLDVNGLTPCIRVDVYRNQARGNPLPIIFGAAVGLTSQGVLATATARVATADSSDCLKPWAIPDKWLDVYDVNPVIDVNTWTADDFFELHSGNNGNGPPLPNPDQYTPASPSGPGTGFTLAADRGAQVVLKKGNPQTSLSPGVFEPVQIPSTFCPVAQGAACYKYAIKNCAGLPISIGDVLISENGDMIGPTKQGVSTDVDSLINQDPNAQWDTATNSVINSCAQANPSCGGSSPRVVAIPVFDTGTYYSTKRQGQPQFVVVNILGFFLEQMQGNDVVGRLTVAPGLQMGSGPPNDPQSAFLTSIQLSR
jgi:Flp pilus assembly protein TadG